jgi:FkbM family methyltransferase
MSGFNPSFQMPSALQSKTFKTVDGKNLELVVSTTPGPYEASFQGSTITSPNAVIAIDCLRGAGTLIDVGANIGTIALPVALSGSNTIAVEMMPSNIMKLRASVLLNRLSNIRIVQAAASDQDAIVTYSGTEAWGTIGAGGGEAAASRLDSLCGLLELGEPGFIKSPVFLKIDVEGHEPQAMNGAVDVIAAFRPYVLFESIDHADQRGDAAALSKSIMEGMGYRLYLMAPNNVIVEPKTGEMQVGLVCDYLAVPMELSGEVSSTFPNFELRALADEEIANWLLQDVAGIIVHKLHVLRYLRNRFAQIGLSDPFIRVIEALLADQDPVVKEEAGALMSQSND